MRILVNVYCNEFYMTNVTRARRTNVLPKRIFANALPLSQNLPKNGSYVYS